MAFSQMWFWRTWIAWWLDGCPAPETWYRMRLMQQSIDRFASLLGERLRPSFEAATASLIAIVRAWETRTP